jgi:hypothetical protein
MVSCHTNSHWRFSSELIRTCDCDLPGYELGGGCTLDSLQRRVKLNRRNDAKSHYSEQLHGEIELLFHVGLTLADAC